jgi:hypothetical protein
MDYPVVQSTAQGYRQQAEVVTTIGKASEALFAGLEASMFWCPPMSRYYGMCKDNVRAKTKDLADMLKQFGADLDGAVADHKSGDTSGKSYFGKG